MVSDKFFVSSAKVHGAHLEPLMHQKQQLEAKQQLQKSDGRRVDKGRDNGRVRVGVHVGDGVWVPVWRVEKFARVFMLIVFVIFNVIYWITAYAT